MTLKTRPPTGRVPWPLILVEGGEKTGKSYLAAMLAYSPKVGDTYWVDLGEGSGDEYLDPTEPRHHIVDHDGTYADILATVLEAKARAAAALAEGRPPVVLIIDTQTAVWELLKDQADGKARRRLAAKGKRLAPDDTPQISQDLWNDANSRHRRLMTALMTFPGIAIMTARGKTVAEVDASGQPVAGRKEYKVEGQKGLAFDASIVIRLSRTDPPTVVGMRMKNGGIRPGVDQPRQIRDLTLESLVFDVLGVGSGTTARQLVQLTITEADLAEAPAPDDPPGPEMMRPEQRGDLFRLLGEADMADRDSALSYINQVIAPASIAGTKDLTAVQAGLVLARLASYIAQQTPPAPTPDTPGETEPPAPAPEPAPTTAVDEPEAPGPVSQAGPTDAQHRRMHALWRDLDYAGDENRANRLDITGRILQREVTTSKELSEADADVVITALENRKKSSRRQASPPAAAAPEQPAAAAPAPQAKATPDQRRDLQAALEVAGFVRPSSALTAINEAIAPARISSMKDLTEAQAAQAIERLRGLVPAA